MNFAYTVIFVEDVAATIDFYERAFGVKRRFVSPNFAQLDTGPTSLAFGSVENEQQQLGATTFRKNLPTLDPAGAQVSFVTDDIQGRFACAVEAGATAVVAPHQMPWGQWISRVRDNNGFLVSIVTAPKF